MSMRRVGGGSSRRAVGLLLAVVGVGLCGLRMLEPRGLAVSSVAAGTEAGAVGGSGQVAAGQPPGLAGCPIFPADNVWNTPVDKLPRDPRTAEYVASIGAEKPVHPDFGGIYGIPFMVIPPATPRVKTTFEYREESDAGDYPVPRDAPVEGGGGPTGDRHVLLIDPARCLLYELFGAQRQADGSWTAGSGITMDLTSNALRPEGWTSADAAGLPILPGLVRYDEVAAGEIRHAVRFTIPRTRRAFIWPARHQASQDASAELPPMGLRLRLRADFDTTRFSRTNQVIMTALKRYGMILADNGGAMFITGAPDGRWSDRDLHRLGAMKASDFEVVDEAELEMMAGSARVDPVVMRRYAGR